MGLIRGEPFRKVTVYAYIDKLEISFLPLEKEVIAADKYEKMLNIL